MKTLKLLLPLFILGALAVAACGSDESGQPTTPQPPASAGLGAGPGISIEEAIALQSPEPVLVNGWIRAEGADVLFCDGVAESYPPQCGGGGQLVVVGIKLEEVDGLQRAADVAWSERTQLLGVVADGKITVSENAVA